jgi:hypothetical protein
MDLLPQILVSVVIVGGIAYFYVRRNRERTANAPLRGQIEAQVRFETILDRVSVLGTGGFGGTRGRWLPVRGPQRLIVGTDAFMVSTPQALREYVFTGREASIAYTRMPSGLVGRARDWIVITGQASGRPVQVAIAQVNLRDIWQALAGAGATIAGEELPARYLTDPPGQPVRAGRYSLRGLAGPLVIILTVDAALWLGGIALPVLTNVGNDAFFVAVVPFLVWFYRARVNADGHGWPQRRSPAWAVAGWIIPVVNFWFPFQIMADIWRAGLPAEARAKPATLPQLWWACWLAFFLLSSVVGIPAHAAWYLAIPVKVIGMLTLMLTALLVQKVSSGPLGGTPR